MQVNRKEKKTKETILSSDPVVAVQDMNKLTKKLIGIMEEESRVLVSNDVIAFAAVETDKDKASKQYEQAAKEFRDRLDEFRTVDRKLIDELETLQGKLSKIAHDNADILKSMNKEIKS